ncbi:gene transfer agent family protein [Sphingomonas sp. MG17]|uniref:Gene transfer agent family protein n=1 Tax=Sphingomonas tagetis TaxID=2949092 RepID=A0A9X2KK61_9SPHN|nr:gene transfer agent family protein [Sphingomonas tagetis]MCP3729252.1 gene transfer agent family protein [Sphingomonas tagetis]
MTKAADKPAANARGEHRLPLGRKTYVLRPSFAAIEAAEEKTGQSLIRLMQLAHSGAMTLRQIGIVAGELIRAGAGDELTANVADERIGELAFEAGLPSVMGRLAVALTDAASGGRTVAGEPKAVAETDSATAN